MERVALELEGEYFDTNEGSRVNVWSLHDRMTRDSREPMLLLLVAVGLLLIIACTNVANLMLARGATRQREIAIRTSMGANGPRIVRLLLPIFFVSGLSSLIYQVVWQRLLTLHYGVGSISITLIVSVYMLGLGLGALLGGWLSERLRGGLLAAALPKAEHRRSAGRRGL